MSVSSSIYFSISFSFSSLVISFSWISPLTFSEEFYLFSFSSLISISKLFSSSFKIFNNFSLSLSPSTSLIYSKTFSNLSSLFLINSSYSILSLTSFLTSPKSSYSYSNSSATFASPFAYASSFYFSNSSSYFSILRSSLNNFSSSSISSS